MIPYGKHFLDEDDISAVVEVLRNGALTQGPKVAEFEQVIASYTGAKYAVAVSSGTAALHLACLAAEITSGDEVYTTTNSFVASSNCILYVGATPVLVDIDSKTLNLDIDELQKLTEKSSKAKAVIPVHFAGYPCDMERVKNIAYNSGLTVIEDASHALGALYKDGSKVGNCSYSDMTVFSFHPVKGIASGEGGMITTNNEVLFQRLLKFRSHGICKGNFEFPGVSFLDDKLINTSNAIEDGELKMWYYEMQSLGFNYRITDIQSALAISQMKKIDKFLNRRRELVLNYDDAFRNIESIELKQLMGRTQSSHHIYVIQIDYEKTNTSRHNLMKRLSMKGVSTQVHYIPIPMHPYYEFQGYKISDYPKTQKYYDTTLTIPLYYDLTKEEQSKVIDSLITCFN